MPDTALDLCTLQSDGNNWEAQVDAFPPTGSPLGLGISTDPGKNDETAMVRESSFRWQEDLDSDVEDVDVWKVFCNVCQGRIRSMRYYW
jgi:hypothetical protein